MHEEERLFWDTVVGMKPGEPVSREKAEIIGDSFDGCVSKALKYIGERFVREDNHNKGYPKGLL